MGEVKSVKVDNWGVFFLQKLQNFFNKTDYCDLTLQFRDNSQLKVHRLVLSACTDFFNVLEQTCELMDDALVMPIELQADVVVPIVNFMYTGTLEFELKMYGKLLKTAKEMNMTVLLKLLEAHKRTMEGTRPPAQKPGSPKIKGRRSIANSPSIIKMLSSSSTVSSTQQPQRRLLTSSNATTPIRRIIAGKPQPGSTVFRQVSNSVLKTAPKMQRGPTRFESGDPNMQVETYESSFDAISYESKPLKEEPEEYEELRATPTKSRSSPFEQLRKGYNNNKRPAVSTFTSPPAKKPNIEDVKEFSEQQRMRKQIAAEYGDDAEYDGVMDDEFHNDDYDDELPAGGPSSSTSAKQQPGESQASIIIKQSPNEKPTIVVKDSSNSKMDHAKIISEVLRQYPHLVKSNKNIKLKIMPNIGGQSQKIIVKKETIDSVLADTDQNTTMPGAQQARQQLLQLSHKQQQVQKTLAAKSNLTVTSTRAEPQTTDSGVATSAVPDAAAVAPQKRRIDSKTMHALIALGAENIKGPWLCLRCGVNGRPISIPSYRGFRRHLINTHKETIDSALCEHCGWRSESDRVLNHHMLVEHKIPCTKFMFPKCDHCTKICLNANDLYAHTSQAHPDSHKQQCIYCNKIFSKEMLLYNHMKTFHKKRARQDGVIDFSDEEMGEFDDDVKEFDKKIKIISDISLPSTILKLEDVPAPMEEDFANDSGPKFVNADGNEMLLTAEQREEIMSQLEQDHDGGVVMVLNETTFPPGETVVVGDTAKAENMEELDDHQIFNEFPQEGEPVVTESNTITAESALDPSKEEEEEGLQRETSNQEPEPDEHDDDHMEWAENVISAHDADEELEEVVDNEVKEEDEEEDGAEKTPVKSDDAKEEEEKVSSSKSPSDSVKEENKDTKKEDDISLKLKMLTGDWTDDEIDEDDDEDGNEQESPTVTKSEKGKTDEQPKRSTSTDIAEKSKSESKMQPEEAHVSHTEEEEEMEPVEVAALPEEMSQTSQSKTPVVADEKMNEEEIETEQLTKKLEDDSTKSKESISSDAIIEPKIKRKLSSATEGRTSRRTSIKGEAVAQTPDEKNLGEAIEEKRFNVKATSPKKSEEEKNTLATVAAVEDKETADIKLEANADEEDSITPTKQPGDDSLESIDKVKSIMSEWADDDDDI